MFYDFAITITKGTSESAASETALLLHHGIIHHVEVQFPVGCAALAHCRLLHHRRQVWPTNPDGSFASDGYTIAFDESYEFFELPYQIIARCWNDDDTYAHTITIRIGILESKTALVFMSVIKGLTKMLNLMGIKV